MTLPENITELANRLFFHCDNLKEVVLLGAINKIQQFAFNYCCKLEKIVIFNVNAPQIIAGENLIKDENILEYHPFGYRANMYTGKNTGKQNFLYLPYGYDASDTTGYNQYLWEEPLQLEGKCNFKLDYIKLDQDVVVSVKDTDGTIIDDEILYFVSEEGDFVTSTTNDIIRSTYNSSKGGYELIFSNNVYHNETITVYKDAEKTIKLGTFIARYGVEYYEVGDVVASYSNSNRRLFSTTLLVHQQQKLKM
jgi:hypothetical protein